MTFNCKNTTLSLAVALLISGCSNPPQQSVEAVHPIVVEQTTAILEVPVNAIVAPGTKNRIAAFARRYAAYGEGPITIAWPNGTDSAAAVASAAATLTSVGVERQQIVEGAYDPQTSDKPQMILSYEQMSAVAKECSTARHDPGTNFKNTRAGYFGCSSQNNLAAMIAQPSDLVIPRAISGSNISRRTSKLKTYQGGEDLTAEDSAKTTD